MTEPQSARRRWPVAPSLLVGLAPIVAFAVVSAVRSRPSDDYEGLGRSTDSLLHALLLPESIAVAVLLVFVTAVGWWRIATVDTTRGTPQWTVVAPVLVVAVSVARLFFVDWAVQPLRYWLVLTAGVLLVGVFEELMTRGVLLVGLRRRMPEFVVWLVSCVLFGLLHFLNVLAGAPVAATVLQVVFAASFGSVLYLSRRLSGNLLLPVLVHAFWDFGAIGVVGAGLDTTTISGRLFGLGLLGLFTFAVLVLGIVAGGVVAWRDDAPRRFRRGWRDVPPCEPAQEPRPFTDRSPTVHGSSVG